MAIPATTFTRAFFIAALFLCRVCFGFSGFCRFFVLFVFKGIVRFRYDAIADCGDLVADCAVISGCHGKSVYYTTARKDGELQQTVINRYSDTDYGAYTVIPASRNSSTKLTRLIVQCVRSSSLKVGRPSMESSHMSSFSLFCDMAFNVW